MSLLGEGQFGQVYRVDGPISVRVERLNYSFDKEKGERDGDAPAARTIQYGAVAVKLLRTPGAVAGASGSDAEHAEEDFFREMAILKTLGHPNILHILSVNRHTHVEDRSAKKLWALAKHRATARASSGSAILVTEVRRRASRERHLARRRFLTVIDHHHRANAPPTRRSSATPRSRTR